MTRGGQFGRHSLGVAVSRVAIMGSVLGTSLITARWLGPHGRGEYSVAVLVAAILVVVPDLLGPGAMFFSARAERSRQRVLGSTVVVSSLIGFATLLVALALLPLRGSLVGDIPTEYLLLALLGVPFGLVVADIAWVQLGLQDFLGFNGVQVVQNALPLVLVAVALIGFGGGPGAAIGATTLSAAIVAVAAVTWGHRQAGGIELRPDTAYVKDAARYGVRAQLAAVLGYLANRIDVLLVNGLMNPSAAGFYSISLATAERTLTVADAASAALLPRVAAEGDDDARGRNTPLVARSVLWMTAIVAAVLFAVSHWLVVLLYTETFEPAVKPLQILLLSMLAAAPARVLGADIAGRGRPILNSYVAAVGLTANVVLNVVLIPRYGMSGAAWASVASYTLSAVLSLVVYLRLSGNTLHSVVVPRRADLALMRLMAASLLGRGSGGEAVDAEDVPAPRSGVDVP